MQGVKNRSIPAVSDKRLHRFIDTIGEVPYVALPPERPEAIRVSHMYWTLSELPNVGLDYGKKRIQNLVD